MNRKTYKSKTFSELEINHVREQSEKEYYYGYYDHSPERNGKIILHEMNVGYVNVIIKELHNNQEIVIGRSKAFNWQLGTRAMWMDDDKIAYNDFDGEKYIGCIYSLNDNSVVLTVEKPIQDFSSKGYFLGVDYQRLRSYAKEYGYYCLPELSDKDFNDYEHDGIWHIDSKNGEYKLLLSIKQVIESSKNEDFKIGKHFVNHIMISPNGDSFIFIHRYYVGKDRKDRLMYYDFKELKCLFDDKLQSHYCWLDDNRVFGYGGYKGRNEFHIVDVRTGAVEICEELTRIHPKDGHPTIFRDWVVIDSYPYFSRMQELIAYNLKSRECIKLLEVFHDMRHKLYDRCDLHPRFSNDGKRIYFDTLYSGKRELCNLDVSNIIK